MVEHGEAKVELQSCSSLRKLCASYRVEFGIKNLHTQFKCKEICWGIELGAEDEVFKGKKRKKIRFFLWRLKTWAFGAHHRPGFMMSVMVVAPCSGFVSDGLFSFGTFLWRFCLFLLKKMMWHHLIRGCK